MRILYYRFYKILFFVLGVGIIFWGDGLYRDSSTQKVNADEAKSDYVYASGHIIGIYGKTDGVLVVSTTEIPQEDGTYKNPANQKIVTGDYIYAANHEKISQKEDLIEAAQKSQGQPVVLSVYRDGASADVSIQPVHAQNGKYYLGIWVKDDLAGIGTMTFFDANGNYGALGHGIGDGETGNLLSMGNGKIYEMSLLGIHKGSKGKPGELEGMIFYDSLHALGSVEKNDKLGIYGRLLPGQLENMKEEERLYKIGYKKDIQKGTAYILSDITGQVKAYEVQIEAVNLLACDSNKCLRFKVIDDSLIDTTGGIVQGMSGSPIIQNNQLIGAVTHVLVDDPYTGYGIFIETMLKQE